MVGMRDLEIAAFISGPGNFELTTLRKHIGGFVLLDNFSSNRRCREVGK
jgi:hypothetical protein